MSIPLPSVVLRAEERLFSKVNDLKFFQFISTYFFNPNPVTNAVFPITKQLTIKY